MSSTIHPHQMSPEVAISDSTATVLRIVAYPAILVGVAAVAAWAVVTAQNLPLVGMLVMFGALAAFIALERVIPFDRHWQPSRREWLRDAIYFGLNGGVDAATKIAVTAAAVAVAPYLDWGAANLPLWFAAPVAILVADFFGYWMHRKSHDIAWLWKVHRVHHAPTKVNTFNNNTAHFLNIVFATIAKSLPLLALGFSAEAVFVAGLFLTIQSFGVHVNADVRLGFLNWVLMGPEHHRLHHSLVLEEAGNHASGLTLWDAIFGTMTWRPGLAPNAVGIVDADAMPDSNRIVANALSPFARSGPTSTATSLR